MFFQLIIYNFLLVVLEIIIVVHDFSDNNCTTDSAIFQVSFWKLVLLDMSQI